MATSVERADGGCWRRARWAAVCTCATGCAATVSDARGDGRDAATVDVVTAPDAPQTADLTVRVTTVPLVPPRLGVDVPVRVQSDAGAFFIARTDATGTARFTVDRARRWDVTVATPGYAAMSVLNVAAPQQLDVVLRAISPDRVGGATNVPLTVRLSGRSAPRTAVILDGVLGSAVSRDDTQSMTVPTWPGAPPFQVIAMEADDGTQFLNGAITALMPRPAGAGVVTVSLPSPARPPTRRVLHVEFPQVGLLAASRVVVTDEGTVARWKLTAAGYGVVPVGRGTLGAPTAAGEASWNLELFDGPLAPEVVSSSVRTTAPALRASVTTEPPFEGLVPAFGVLRALQSNSDTAGVATLTADLDAWDRGAFQVVSTDGTVVWEGYSFGREASWTNRAMPVLPDGLTPSQLLRVGRSYRVRACALRDLPRPVAPWSSPLPAMQFRSLLTVCEEVGSVVAP